MCWYSHHNISFLGWLQGVRAGGSISPEPGTNAVLPQTKTAGPWCLAHRPTAQSQAQGCLRHQAAFDHGRLLRTTGVSRADLGVAGAVVQSPS